MQSLYKINQDLIELFTEFENNEGEVTEELEQRLAIKEGELQQKSVAYVEVIGQQESFINRIDEEIKRLQSLKKQKTNLVDRLKNNLLNAVMLFGDFEAGLYKFGKRKSSQVKVDNINALPDEFKVVKVTEQANKKAIKEALNNGENIEGCEIVTNYSLNVK